MGRFVVIEYLSHFSVRDTHTGQERPMSDGVDVLIDHDGTPFSPGMPGFAEAWAEALNADESETLQAYFTEPVDQESES